MSEYDDYGPRRHEWIGKEGASHYIPAWYERHANLDVSVTIDGEDQGFKIRNVLPFRRWAIGADGEVVPQHVFTERYRQYLEGFKHPETWDINAEFVPNVRHFVREKFDLNGQLVDISYNDDKRVEKTEKFTSDGDIAPEWLAKNTDQAAKLSKIEALTELLKDGILTKEQYTEKTTAILGVAATLVQVSDESPKAEPPKPRKKFTMSEEHKAKLAAGRARRAAEDAEKAASA